MAAAPPPLTWGTGGILQSRQEHDILMLLDKEANLPELAARLHTCDLDAIWSGGMNKYSLYAQYCYGEDGLCSVVMRKYLGSGVLQTLADRYLDRLEQGDAEPTVPDVRTMLILLAAGAMSHGAALPSGLRQSVKGLLESDDVHPSLRARAQMLKALRDYKHGTPYKFGNESLSEYLVKQDYGLSKAILKTEHTLHTREITLVSLNGDADPTMKPGGLHAGDVLAEFDAPKDDLLDPLHVHPYNVCGNCGKSETADGKKLQSCARCQKRKYCSRDCQKAMHARHKLVCTRPAELMADLHLKTNRMGYVMKAALESLAGIGDGSTDFGFPGLKIQVAKKPAKKAGKEVGKKS